MGFAGFKPGLQDVFNAWRLPDRIVREFNLRLVHDVEGMSPTDFEMSSEGMRHKIVIHDHGDPGNYYVFTLHFRRDDENFWITGIHGVGLDQDNKPFWSSTPKMMGD